jgi:peptidoglycan/LPS O-acetylase OafA/YrhL
VNHHEPFSGTRARPGETPAALRPTGPALRRAGTPARRADGATLDAPAGAPAPPIIGKAGAGERTDHADSGERAERSPQTAGSGPRLAYVPAVDGLRAVAVAAVVGFHAGLTWLPGGFLGVEVFFAISGFLITALLWAEVRRTGRIDLGHFWLRRARRLLPALLVMLAAVASYMALFVPDELVDLRDDVAAALTYTTNWFLVATDVSYFEALGRPPLLQHLWSLAIEEQFYLLWPLLFGGLAVVLKRRHGLLGRLLLLGAAASALWMYVQFVPDADPSRVYYGTDTRAAGLLLGAAAAVLWSPWRLRRTEPSASLLLDGVGLLAALGLCGALLKWDAFAPTVYRGGFALVSLLTVVVVAVAVHPSARLVPAMLGLPPLVWIGLRSYGIYLWHWPVFMLTRPRLDVPLTGTALMVFRIGLTVGLAALSYRFVEVPVRNGALGRGWRRFQESRGEQRLRLLRVTGVAALAVTIGLALVAGSLLRADGPGGNPLGILATADASGTAGVGGARGDAAATPATEATTTGAAAAPGEGEDGPSAAHRVVPPPTSAQAAAPADLPRTITVVGDSTAMSLAINFPSDMAETLVVHDGSTEGCGIVDRGAMRSASHQRRSFGECEGYAAEWSQAVSSTQPDVALVVIGAWEVFDLDLEDGVVQFGSAEHEDFLRANLRRGVDALLQTPARIALLEVPCYHPVDGGGLQALPERGDQTRTALLNRLLRELAEERSDRISLVRSPEAFCSDATTASDLGLRWDGVHYGPLGGDYVWDAIAPELVALPAA